MQVPYHKPCVGQAEEAAVARVLQSGWLTTGAEAQAFAQEFCAFKGGGYAYAVTSCTDGLRLLLASLHLPQGAEVILPPISFVSTAHVVLQCGLVPVFADVEPGTLLIDPQSVQAKISARTRALIVVHVAGHMCNMDTLTQIAAAHNLYLIEDCAHALESTYHGRPSGSFGYGSSFSFYANKNITTGEGGMLWTQDAETNTLLGLWRNHGLNKDAFSREKGQAGNGRFVQYDIVLPGFKNAMADMPAAIGRVQLQNVTSWHNRRLQIVDTYVKAFQDVAGITPLMPLADSVSAWHLFIVRLDLTQFKATRDEIMAAIIAKGVGLSLHFKPIHLMQAYQNLGWQLGALPQAEAMYATVFSLPIYPLLTSDEQEYVMDTVVRVLNDLRN